MPWRGLYGLIVSSGKGILWYCPAAVFVFFLWRPFHKRYPAISYTILASVILRILFIAGRSDWHGGFSLGPRYLVVAIPLLFIPYGEAFAERAQEHSYSKLWTLFLFGLLCIWEQIYFALGEIFTFLHSINWMNRAHGINVFQDDHMYLDWDTSPLFSILSGERGPFLLRNIGLDNASLFWICALITGTILVVSYVQLLKTFTGSWHSASTQPSSYRKA